MELDDILHLLRVLRAVAQRIDTVDPTLREFCQVTVAQAAHVLHAGDAPDQASIDRIVEVVMQSVPSKAPLPEPVPEPTPEPEPAPTPEVAPAPTTTGTRTTRNRGT